MKKSTTIAGLALTMLAVYAILNLVSINRQVRDAAEQTQQLRLEIEAAQAEGSRLEEKLEAVNNGSGLEDEARIRFRLIGAGETIFADID